MEYVVSRQINWGGLGGEKAVALMGMFGVRAGRLRDGIRHTCGIHIDRGEICYVTGASGSGKSLLLREFYKLAADEKKIDLNEIELADDKAVVECFDMPLAGTLRVLSMVGLSDVFCMLNVPAKLSEGQQYRFRLAMAMASGREIIFADEFCSNLDRITAAVIAYSVRKFARREGKTFFLASSHDDIVGDLEPEVLVIKKLDGSGEVVYKNRV